MRVVQRFWSRWGLRRAVVCALLGLALSSCGPEGFRWPWEGPSPRCVDYCARVVECELDSQIACETSCMGRETLASEPLAETCVLDESCAKASRCVLCAQYCERLDECGVSTDESCASSCDTVLAGGADPSSYQCVVDSACEEISACGI